jgi:hypothetical protein
MRFAHELGGKEKPGPPTRPNDPAARFDRLFNKLFLLIPLGVIGNIVYSVTHSDQAMLVAVARFSPACFGMALLLSVVPWFTGSLRMFIWGRFLGKDVRYRDMLQVALGAELGAAVSPPLLGGGPAKIWLLTRRGFSGGAALSLAALEGFEDAVFFIVMVPVALTVSAAWDQPIVKTTMSGLEQPMFWAWAGGAGALLVVCILLLRRGPAGLTARSARLRALAGHILSAYRQFRAIYGLIARNGKTVFLLTMTLTTIQWLCRYSIISLLLLGLGIPPRPLLFMALQVLVFALMTFIPTPGGVGGAEALFTAVYGSFLPHNAIGVVTAGWRFFTFYFLLLLAAALFLVFGLRPAAAAKGREAVHRPIP